MAALKPGTAVLDVGCGNGVPVAAALLDAGFAVTGVDLSEEQVRRAVERLPPGRFLVADVAEIEFPPNAFGGVVAWDSIFHVPPAEHAELFVRIHGWLSPGAPVLFTAGGTGGEIYNQHLGAPMYYGALPPGETLARLAAAGFTLVEHLVDDPMDGGHMVIMAHA